MTAQAVQNLPFPKFTRAGFGFSSKSHMTTKMAESDEDWYIPYNGPYEAPREPPSRRKARDSWGDLVEPDDEEDLVLNDRELHLRYGGHNDYSGTHLEEERGRDTMYSVTTRQTVSSGAIDPSRPSMGARRSTVSAGTRHNLSSYISMDAAGGVGESPIPPRRSSQRSQERNRMSLASIFNFNTQPRKPSKPTAASAERIVSKSFMRKPSFLQSSNADTHYHYKKAYSKIDAPERYRSSPEHPNAPIKDKHQQLHHQVMLHAGRLSSDTTEADYYQSYYSTLVHDHPSDLALDYRQRHHRSPSHSEDLHHSRGNSSSTRSDHPYARALPRNNVEESSKTPQIPQQPTFTVSPPNPNSIEPPNFSLPRLTSPRRKLGKSISTPELRNSAVLHRVVVTPPIVNSTPQTNATRQFAVPKGKDRWLSAETWCDAVLFPRPRLKAGMVSTLAGGSGRIISPPDSPVDPSHIRSTGKREPGIASRVLAHSLSLVDLNKPVGLSSSPADPLQASTSSQARDPQTSGAGLPVATLAQDDLAPSTPVPSLAQVLEQGQQLANERKAWQLQAQNSFGNKRTRTLVKPRPKALSQNGHRKGHQVQTSLDYLAAQACLGNQNMNPIVSVKEMNSTKARSPRRRSQSQTTTLCKTLTKSSKSHSRGGSWSKSAAKVAQSTAAICGFSAVESEVPVLREGDLRAASLEGAIRGDGTKVIRLADPVYIPVDHGPPANPSPDSFPRLTPSPSSASEQEVGIALGTPPLGDDQSYYPSHPYARGGLSFGVPSPAHIDRGVDFAGRHPSVNSNVDVSQIPDTLARHKLPPHIHLHPYAQGSARDSYLDQNGLLARYRSDSETPRQMKMWAQLSPGVLQEVLPDDFQYSPFIPQKESNTSPVDASSRYSLQIHDTIGVGETLVNAARFGASGVGTNVIHADVLPMSQVDGAKQSQNILPEFGPRTIRQPIKDNLVLSEDSGSSPKPFLPNQDVSASPQQHLPPLLLPDHAASTSPTVSSTSSSPPLTPRRLGSPNDLENFQDLFYRPSNDLRRTPNEAALPDTPSPPYISNPAWNHKMQRSRTESSLTSLARQLSQEFKLMTQERERSGSQPSSVPSATRQQSGGVSRRSKPGSLKFVFEEAARSSLELGPEDPIHAFQASDSLPEDVESSRASSVIERAEGSDTEEDNTAILRVGVVESILTPTSVSPQDRPNSYAGETSSATNDEVRQQNQPTSPDALGVSSEARPRISSGLLPPSSDATRSSYTTTSTASRMSGLSDFPSPPRDHHMSLRAYFNEPLDEVPPPPPDQQLFFGGNQDAGDLAKTLSSSS